MTRECLPDRRHSWTQKVVIDGQTFYLSVGEYPDRRVGEIWIDCSKAGSFLRGIVAALARLASVALQCRAGLPDVVKAMSGLNFPPNGPVEGSPVVKTCMSVPDWVAQELKAVYLDNPPTDEPTPETLPEKSMGYVPEDWRTGA